MDPFNGVLVFACLLVTWLVHKYAWPLWGKNGHPLGLIIFMQVIVLTLPGVSIVTFASECLGSITCELVSQYTPRC